MRKKGMHRILALTLSGAMMLGMGGVHGTRHRGSN